MKQKHDYWDAEYYKKNSQIQFWVGMYILNNLLQLKGNESVLDIGCGDGKITAEIAQRVPQGTVLGIDASPSMIAESKSQFATIKNMDFQLADATTFLSETPFDLIVSFSTFHWIQDKERALTNIFSMLKPGGTMVIFMQNGESDARKKVFESAKWKPYFSTQKQTRFYIDPQDMTTLLKQCGFTNISVTADRAPITYDNEENVFNWAHGFSSAATGLHGDQAEEFAQDIAKSVCEKLDKNTGKFVEHLPFLYATAQRSM